jgi:hypothetical protein
MQHYIKNSLMTLATIAIPLITINGLAYFDTYKELKNLEKKGRAWSVCIGTIKSKSSL